jgi:nucleotide-binding universal stress UspA family protein
MISKILVALDDSARAPHVALVAGALAARLRATLIPFRVIPFPQDFPAAGAGGRHDELPAILLEEATRALQALVVPVTGVEVEPPVIGVGDPARGIIAAAERLNVDLIAIGSHGYHGWDRLLGTTVSEVANRATRNVFVIHDPAHLGSSDPLHRRGPTPP